VPLLSIGCDSVEEVLVLGSALLVGFAVGVHVEVFTFFPVVVLFFLRLSDTVLLASSICC
jgi:hypothetical protein